MLINIFDMYYKSNFIFKVVILVDLGILVSLVVCQLIWGVFLQRLLVLLLVTTMVDLPIVSVVLQIVFVVKRRILKVSMLKCIILAIKRIRLMVGMLKCIELAIERIRLMVH